MASKADLVKIGKEGFALLKEYTEKKGKTAARQRPEVPQGSSQACVYQYQPKQTHFYQVKPVSAAEEMMNSYEVVQFHDGVSIMDYSKRKPRAMAY